MALIKMEHSYYYQMEYSSKWNSSSKGTLILKRNTPIKKGNTPQNGNTRFFFFFFFFFGVDLGAAAHPPIPRIRQALVGFGRVEGFGLV